ncbi:MAG: hypothetical protein AAGG51_11160 [Cyanobacteria bacterium P01_G01_bin.54]
MSRKPSSPASGVNKLPKKQGNDKFLPKPTVTGAMGGAIKAIGKSGNQNHSSEQKQAGNKFGELLILSDRQMAWLAGQLALVSARRYPEGSKEYRAVLSQGTIAILILLNECRNYGVFDLAQIACLLGSVEIESQMGVVMYEDWPGVYEYAEANYDGGYEFRGRGYAQLTGKANYQRIGNIVEPGRGDELLRNPNIAAEDKALAGKIAVLGMRDGLFTQSGRGLNSYVNEDMTAQQRRAGFANAREILNPGEEHKKEELANRSEAFLQALKYLLPRVPW